jgi:hypothetical protein
MNYSGNAFERFTPEKGNFDVMPIPPIACETVSECDCLEKEKCESVRDEKCEKIDKCDKCEEKGKPNFLSGLFGGKLFPRGIGNEELLLLALILIVAQSGEADELLIYLVILLLT